MVEQTCADYAKILQSANLDREINPLCTNIEDMLARLDEFETLLSNVRAESNGIMEHNVCGIIHFSENFEQLKSRIDNLEQFVGVVNENLNQVERSVDIAEEELHVTDYSFKGLVLKPLMSKAKLSGATASAESEAPCSNLIEGEYQAVPVFKTTDYFAQAFDTSTSPPPIPDALAPL